MKLFEEEGIPLGNLEFPDNQGILELLKKKPTGVMPMLDEECFLPKGEDKGYCSKIWKAHEKHKSMKLVKKNQSQFTILHFAGEVPYETTNFVEKNRDTLSDDCVSLIDASQIP